MTLIEFVKLLLALLTLLSDIAIVIALLIFIFQKFIYKKQLSFSKKIVSLIKKHGLEFAFIAALTATLGSLFYSEIVGFVPCKLCWYQRILMYPQVIILAVAIKKKARDTADYIIPLSAIGGIIAAIHYGTQFSSKITICNSLAEDCTIKYLLHYGYITIPMMALTAFILTGIFTYFYKKG